MGETRIAGLRSPAWIRATQIGIGAVAIVLSISAMIFPSYAVVAAFLAAGIVLFLIGIEQVVVGLFLYKRSRLGHIALGALVMIIAGIIIAEPLGAGTLIIWLSALALLIAGVISIISGVVARGRRNRIGGRRGSRTLSIVLGALAVGLSLAIVISPTFGVGLAAFLIGLGLLFCGIRLVITGIVGRGTAVATPAGTMAA